jgi:CheY-like chemotaxis protein
MRTKVLVVENEPLLLMMAVDVAEDAGFEVIEARDADEAIRVLERIQDIRILWTDIDMPGSMDGLLLAAAARDRWPPIEIVVVSGLKKPVASDLPVRSEFFSKPYDVGKMMEALVRLAG